MKLHQVAKKLEDDIDETLAYMDFPMEHCTRIRTNDTIQRLNQEIRQRTKDVVTFQDGNSTLILCVLDFVLFKAHNRV